MARKKKSALDIFQGLSAEQQAQARDKFGGTSQFQKQIGTTSNILPKAKKPIDVVSGLKPKEIAQDTAITFGQGGQTPTPGATDMASQFTRAPSTVATETTPIVDKDKMAEFGMDLTDMDNLDPNQLADTLDILEAKIERGEGTTDDVARLRKARRLTQSQFAEPDLTGLEKLIADQQAAFEAEKLRLRSQGKELEAQKAEQLQRQFERQSGLVREAGEDRKTAQQGALSFSGFGRSTFAADKADKIQQGVNQQVSALDQARQLEMNLFRQQQAGVEGEALAGLQTQISNLKQAAVKFQIDAINEANKINKEMQLTQIDRINNLMEVAGQGLDRELSEQEQGLVSQWAKAALDKDGVLDDKILEQIPENLRPFVIAQSAALTGLKGNYKFIPRTKTQGAGYFNEDTGEFIAIGRGTGGGGGGAGSGGSTVGSNDQGVGIMNELIKRARRIRENGNIYRKSFGAGVPRTDSATVKGDVAFLRKNLTLDALKAAKKAGATFGAMSEEEWKILGESATSLKRDLPEDSFNQELDRIILNLGGEVGTADQAGGAATGGSTAGVDISADSSDEDIINALNNIQ